MNETFEERMTMRRLGFAILTLNIVVVCAMIIAILVGY